MHVLSLLYYISCTMYKSLLSFFLKFDGRDLHTFTDKPRDDVIDESVSQSESALSRDGEVSLVESLPVKWNVERLT